jgi:hypothetical protein
MAALAKPGLDDMDVFALISKWSLKVQTGKKRESEWFLNRIIRVASRANQEICRLAYSGNEKAALILYPILSANISAFNNLCHGKERARELRLYAARLEVLDGRNLGKWEYFASSRDFACRVN